MIDRQYLEALRAAAESSLATAQACLKAIEYLEREKEENKWVTLERAAEALGDISPEMLADRCRDGRFTYKQEFTNFSDGKRSTYRVKIAAVRKFLETDPAKRSPSRRVV